jgi:hypothetical protein
MSDPRDPQFVWSQTHLRAFFAFTIAAFVLHAGALYAGGYDGVGENLYLAAWAAACGALFEAFLPLAVVVQSWLDSRGDAVA